MNQEGVPTNQTKIVCTIGPASSTPDIIKKMIKAGMDTARINFSHGGYEANLGLLNNIRAAAKQIKKPIATMLDLQGPKIRVGQLPIEGLELVEGNLALIHAGIISGGHGEVPVPYDRLARDVKVGDRILFADGAHEVEVRDVKGPIIRAKVLIGGRLLSYKGINVPTAYLSVETFTEKDEQDLEYGLQHNFDFVAMSFVRTGADIVKVKEKIKKYLPKGIAPPFVIAKIEKHEALVNFPDILEEADGIMIARGDLGLETPSSQVPLRQKELIARCIVVNKPVIIATQMLESMQSHPRPTRAEVSDVANAVIDHADAVMLSGETAMGSFPVQAVQTMAQIIHDTEESPLDNLLPHRDAIGEPIPSAVAAGAVEIARHIDAAAIIVTTRSGYSARAIARYRPEKPIFAATDRPRTRGQLHLSWGVVPIDIEGYDVPEKMIQKALKVLIRQQLIRSGSKVVVVSGLKRPRKGYDSAVRVVEV